MASLAHHSLLLAALTTLGLGALAGFTAPPVPAGGAKLNDPSTSAAASLGTLIVLNKSEANASLIDRATGKELARVETGTGPHEAAVSPDGNTCVVADYGAQQHGETLSVIDLTKRERVKVIQLGENKRPHGIMYFPDGKRVAVTSEFARTLIVVNVETGEIEQTLGTDANGSHMVALSPDAKRAYVANISSNSMTAFDLEKGERLAVIPTGPQAEGIDVSPDGREVWVSNRAGHTVSIVNAESLEVEATIDCPQFPIRVKFTPDGRHVLISNAQSGDVAVFDAKSREIIKRIAMTIDASEVKTDEDRLMSFGQSPVPIGILIPPDGKHAYIANTNADIVTVIDLEAMSIAKRLTAGKQPDGMAWSPLVLNAD